MGLGWPGGSARGPRRRAHGARVGRGRAVVGPWSGRRPSTHANTHHRPSCLGLLPRVPAPTNALTRRLGAAQDALSRRITRAHHTVTQLQQCRRGGQRPIRERDARVRVASSCTIRLPRCTNMCTNHAIHSSSSSSMLLASSISKRARAWPVLREGSRRLGICTERSGQLMQRSHLSRRGVHGCHLQLRRLLV